MASIPRYLSIPLPNGSRISILHSLPFFLVHLAALLVFFMFFGKIGGGAELVKVSTSLLADVSCPFIR